MSSKIEDQYLERVSLGNPKCRCRCSMNLWDAKFIYMTVKNILR